MSGTVGSTATSEQVMAELYSFWVELVLIVCCPTIQSHAVSPLSCVSCVPASCVHIWFVSCPRLM